MEFPFHALRVKRWGDSLVVVLPRAFREQLVIREGDLLAVRVHAPYATFCVWPVTRTVPLENIPVGALPPTDPRKIAPRGDGE